MRISDLKIKGPRTENLRIQEFRDLGIEDLK
jgi:hypothetical protein